MKGFVLALGSVLMLVGDPAAAVAQGTKTVTGSIAAVSAKSITVTADGKEMTFVIDSDTTVVARGGSTKTRAAQKEGKGVTAPEVLKVGQAVEVSYHEQGMRAASIRGVSAVPTPDKSQTATATGVVSAISGNSLTVKGGAGEWTFAVDENTTVSGTGVGTEARKLATQGKASRLADFVKVGDSVDVSYHAMGDTKHASVIRITRRKM